MSELRSETRFFRVIFRVLCLTSISCIDYFRDDLCLYLAAQGNLHTMYASLLDFIELRVTYMIVWGVLAGHPKISFSTRHFFLWFRNPAIKTTIKPGKKWDKLSTSTGFFPDFWTINSITSIFDQSFLVRIWEFDSHFRLAHRAAIQNILQADWDTKRWGDGRHLQTGTVDDFRNPGKNQLIVNPHFWEGFKYIRGGFLARIPEASTVVVKVLWSNVTLKYLSRVEQIRGNASESKGNLLLCRKEPTISRRQLAECSETENAPVNFVVYALSGWRRFF